MSTQKQLVRAFLLAIGVATLLSSIPANAQFTPIVKPNDIANQDQLAPGNTPATPAPPPPGDGATPTPVNAGDTGTISPVPTGTADAGPGTSMPVGTGVSMSTVRLWINEGSGNGLYMVQTLRPSSLTQQQLTQIQGIIGQNMLSGEPFIDATITEDQMAQINQVLFPYPNATNNGGRQQITADSPAAGYPKETALYDFQGPLPTVRTFARYLVLLGVVAATVWIAFGATAVVLGHPYAGARVVGSVAGLMLLLMAYTIWKIVQMDTLQANSNTPAVINQKSGQGQVNDAYLVQPNVPVTPTAPNTTARSPLPVAPLSGN